MSLQPVFSAIEAWLLNLDADPDYVDALKRRAARACIDEDLPFDVMEGMMRDILERKAAETALKRNYHL